MFGVRLTFVKDRTHSSEYYRPEYDLKPDHGTVRQLLLKKCFELSLTQCRAIRLSSTRVAWQYQ